MKLIIFNIFLIKKRYIGLNPKPMNQFNDTSVWSLFIEGDPIAFATLFKQYYPQLHNYGIKISSDHMITEDCLQSFFVYLNEHRKNIGAIHSIQSYLFVSFRRALLRSLKHEGRFTTYDEIIDKKDVFAFSAEELKIEQEALKIKSNVLTKLLNELSVREREVIYLKYYSGLCTADISEVMDINYQSVLNTLQKAFYKLRKRAESHEILRALNV